MGFNTSNGAAAQSGRNNGNGNSRNANNSGDNNATGDNPSWKAAGFLNVYLPAKDGTRVKLGAIKLHEAKDREKELADWLEGAADESRLNTLLAALQFEYNSARVTEGRGFDLPGLGE